jgi:tRNA dimethylallyltransferase
MERIIVILGPTASGKSSLALKLAKKFNGEIISADSRQVYEGMDLGTGKVTKQEQKLVPHHLLDVASPKRQFTAAQFKKLSDKAIKDITKRGKLPFLVGGTAFYIYSVIDNVELPEAKPDTKLRKKLEKKTAPELFEILKKIDPKRAKTIDKHNRVRLIRAIEIVEVTGKPVPASPFPALNRNDSVLILGIKKDIQELEALIDKRVDERLNQGMVAEVKKLKANKISSRRIKQIGLTYAVIEKYLDKLISKDEMVTQVKIAERQLAKRQMTWFKRDSRIKWITTESEAVKLIQTFLK